MLRAEVLLDAEGLHVTAITVEKKNAGERSDRFQDPLYDMGTAGVSRQSTGGVIKNDPSGFCRFA